MKTSMQRSKREEGQKEGEIEGEGEGEGEIEKKRRLTSRVSEGFQEMIESASVFLDKGPLFQFTEGECTELLACEAPEPLQIE